MFTVLVVVALSRTVLPRWLAVTGYVIWCAWLIAVAVVLFRVRVTPGNDARFQVSSTGAHGG